MEFKNFLVLIIGLVLIWGGTIVFMIKYNDDINKDPCLKCAELMGEKVVCTIGGVSPATRTYMENGTIFDYSVYDGKSTIQPKLNDSFWEDMKT